jgi:aconitate hydratase
VAGREIYQSYIGSSANPGFRDFAIAASIVEGRQVHDRVSFDVNPTSRQILEGLMDSGYLQMLTRAGARIHQTGCNGCIGMGQAPATGKISLRTVPRNFPGRSGTKEDAVYLCSPETAAASALAGEILDPRDLEDRINLAYPTVDGLDEIRINEDQLVGPADDAADMDLEKGPNIAALPEFDVLPADLDGPVILKVGDDISTDEIMPAGARVLPFRSNIPEISKFVFSQIDDSFYERAQSNEGDGFFVVAGENYGQGSSREHAAIAPRYLGLRCVIAVSFARIHLQNLANFGILALTFQDPSDVDRIDQGHNLAIDSLRSSIQNGSDIVVLNRSNGERFKVTHSLSELEIQSVLEGSLINRVRRELAG